MSVYKDARITWSGVNISAQVRAAALELGANAPSDTAMGDNWEIAAAGGLKTAALEMELNWVAGSTTAVDHLFGSTGFLGQGKALTFRATTAAISAANPEYSGTFVVTGYTPFQGNVGDQHVANASLSLGSALARAIST